MCPAKTAYVSVYFCLLFGNGVYPGKLTWEQQADTLSQTKLLYHNNINQQKVVMLINLWINPVVCSFVTDVVIDVVLCLVQHQ